MRSYVTASDVTTLTGRRDAGRLPLALLATLLLALASIPGCGSGGGGGSGLAAGPAYWAIPFVPTTASRTLVLGARNLGGSSTSIALSAYRPDGTAYAATSFFPVDGGGELILSLSTALSGNPASGGIIYVSTPSRLVEIWFDVEIPALLAAEASRAFALPDLGAPPPGPFHTGVNATLATTSIQLANASGGIAPLTVTAFAESLLDPLAPPVATVVALPPFAAGESRVFTPDALSGITGFVGSFFVESPSPVVAAAEEDLAFDIPRVATATRTVTTSVSFGRDPTTVFASYLDFVIVVRNDGDSTQTIQLTSVYREDGTPLFAGVRSIALAAHESRTIATTQDPLSDVVGDVLLTSAFGRFSLQFSVPAGVDVGVRQFEPQFFGANMTLEPTPVGHVLMVSDVQARAVLPSLVRTIATVYNPNNVPITVTAEAVVTQPSGFDASVVLISTMTVPAHGQVEISPDGTTYADRDLVVADYIGLRFRSDAAFGAIGRRVTRLPSNAIETLVPLPVRSFDDGE